MVKHILIELEDEEYEALRRIKGRRTWKELLLSLLEQLEDPVISCITDCIGMARRLRGFDPF